MAYHIEGSQATHTFLVAIFADRLPMWGTIVVWKSRTGIVTIPPGFRRTGARNQARLWPCNIAPTAAERDSSDSMSTRGTCTVENVSSLLMA
jgi:hypothetical protein